MKTKYIKPTVDAASEIEAPVVLAAVSLPVEEGNEEITNPSEQLSKKNFFPLWEDDEE